MVTVIVRGGDAPEALARALGPLVAGVVAGLVAEVLVVAAPAATEVARLTEGSGAELVASESWQDGLAAAVRRARQSRLLVLDAGVILGEGFWAELAEHGEDAATALVTTPRDAPVLFALRQRITRRAVPDQAVVLPGRMATGDPWSMALPLRRLAARSYRIATRT